MVARRRSAREIFVRISSYVRRYPWFAIGTIVCAVVTTVANLAFPKLTQLVIDEVMGAKRGDLLLPFAGLVLLSFFLRDGFNILRIQLNNRFEQRVIFDLRRDLYDKLQRLSVNYFDQRASGDLMTRVIEDVNAVERVLIDGTEQGTISFLGDRWRWVHDVRSTRNSRCGARAPPDARVGGVVYTAHRAQTVPAGAPGNAGALERVAHGQPARRPPDQSVRTRAARAWPLRR